MAQFARPNSDIDIPTGVTGGYTDVDEAVPNGTDFIEATRNSLVKLGLSIVTDPEVDTDHYVRFKVYVTATGPPPTVDIYLKQGTTTIWDDNVTINTTPTVYTFSIPTANAANITDYSNLNVEIKLPGGFGSNSKLDQLEFEVPDAPGGGEPTPRRRIFLIS